ncbi:AAA family ATPase [Agrobacterium rhizogenes]|nr:AAA family ATPase [Rhizobium rhizogenes]NTJ32130.1 AAA family ATPase [Rhizobium rhizogenes]
MDRIFIMGNGGSGKTWLALELARKLKLPAVHLDDLHWMPNFGGERPREERNRLVAEAAAVDHWIMEGIYGTIIKQVLPRVMTLVWLDVPDDECVANIRLRGVTGGGTLEQFDELLEYTGGYRIRKNHMNSFVAHREFFEEHPSRKIKLYNRSEIAAFLTTI